MADTGDFSSDIVWSSLSFLFGVVVVGAAVTSDGDVEGDDGGGVTSFTSGLTLLLLRLLIAMRATEQVSPSSVSKVVLVVVMVVALELVIADSGQCRSVDSRDVTGAGISGKLITATGAGMTEDSVVDRIVSAVVGGGGISIGGEVGGGNDGVIVRDGGRGAVDGGGVNCDAVVFVIGGGVSVNVIVVVLGGGGVTRFKVFLVLLVIVAVVAVDDVDAVTAGDAAGLTKSNSKKLGATIKVLETAIKYMQCFSEYCVHFGN
ncbi:Hypothetical predicted protein [Octopus vulgaris]|uniref:Uncharacterized protein n=1 Tax=Octopus vulgaris TaxID=6645 RepID=A0AA36EY17_OCTVU|nr:Hypothetical predicted protein [Octopus vulgaris]